MTFTLFGSQGSGSAIVDLALRRCGVDYRVVRASTWEKDSARDELARVNPLGQIPTLVWPDGRVMSESAAILIELGLSFTDSGLLPADAGQRAQTLRGLVFIAANCYSAISIIDYPERWTQDRSDASRKALIQGTKDRLHRHWEIFADLHTPADDAGFLSCADRPGALDMMAVVVSRWGGARAHLAAQRPRLHALLQRLQAHPDFEAVMREHWPPKA